MNSGSMSSFETVIYERQGPLARILLNRPRVLNAYNVQMRDDVYEALTAVSLDPDVKALVISGAGDRAFCAGADLTEFGTAPSQRIARQVRWERDVWGVLMDLPDTYDSRSSWVRIWVGAGACSVLRHKDCGAECDIRTA